MGFSSQLILGKYTVRCVWGLACLRMLPVPTLFCVL